MLNLKKGLALVLAAATALTFAPVANLGASVQAEAATGNITLSVDGTPVSSIDVAKSGDKSVDFEITGVAGTETFKAVSNDTTVATVQALNNGAALGAGTHTVNDVTTGPQVKVTGVDSGDTSVTLQAGSTRKRLGVRVLGTMTVTDADFNLKDKVSVPKGTKTKIGTVTLTGTEFSTSLVANDPAKQNRVTASGTDFNFNYVTTGVNSDRTKATVDVYATSANAEKSTTTVNVTANGENKNTKITTLTAAAGTFNYGGVLSNIYAYKDASYDLAEHASIHYVDNGGDVYNLTGSQINWYITASGNTPTVGEHRDNIQSLNIPAEDGSISKGAAGSLTVKVSSANKFADDVTGSNIVAEAYIKGVRTVVYTTPLTVTPIAENVEPIKQTITTTVSVKGTQDDKDKDILDNKIANPTEDNKYLQASQVIYQAGYDTIQTGTKYTATVNKADGTANPFKGSKLNINGDEPKNGSKLDNGTYYETLYIPFKVTTGGDTVYIQKVNVVISVNTGVKFRVKDGSSILATTYGDADTLANDPTVYLNLADTKTWNIYDHIEADADKTKINFSYSSDSANADVDNKGVITAKSVGNAVITIKASYNGIDSQATLTVRVNQNPFDTVTVKGEDGETARVLGVRDYDNNNEADIRTTDPADGRGEQLLVTRQIPYVQIEITGNETQNVVEKPVVTSANSASLAYSFETDNAKNNGLTIDPQTGVITIDYNQCNNPYNALGVYAVKVVSAATAKSEATTNYYYVVVDFKDQPISGLQDSYTIGACNASDSWAWHESDANIKLFDESNGSAKNFKEVNKTNKIDDFKGTPYYKDDNKEAFTVGGIDANKKIKQGETLFDNCGYIFKAESDKQTMHVVAYNKQNTTDKLGYTAKLITVNSAPAVENKVTKITNRDTGAVIYDDAKDSKKTAVRLSISDVAHIQVSLAHPVASVASGSAVTLGISSATNANVINQTWFVTAVKNTNDVDITLYPNFKGTQVITVSPEGHLTVTDRTDIHKTSVQLAVEYDGKNGDTSKPAKITGVKVGNKKGAKVVVKFTKSSLDKNGLSMKYYVQKKIGKKTSGKSIGSARTTLSVKKGATVKVRVKAYYYDAAGQKHVGAYSKWVTKKTDKK